MFGSLVVGHGREETDKSSLTVDLAFGIKCLDADVVHVHRAVHGRANISFGDDDGLGHTQEVFYFVRQFRQAAFGVRENVKVRIAQYPQPGTFDGFVGCAFGRRFVGVLAITQEREMIVRQPFEK